MTLTTRLYAVFALCLLLIISALSCYTVTREYRLQLRTLRLATSNRLLANPALPLHIFRRSKAALARSAREFTADHRITDAIIYDGLGEQLASASAGGTRSGRIAPFGTLREHLMATEESVVLLDRSGRIHPPSLFNALRFRAQALNYSLPILSPVDPVEPATDEMAFAAALSRFDREPSTWVAGYLYLAADNSALVSAALSAGRRLFLLALAIAACLAPLYLYFTRRVTRPLRQVRDMAVHLAEGNPGEPPRLQAPGELGDIARAINHIVENVRSFKVENELSRRLLTDKVEERKSQLSERDAALDRAAQEAEQRRRQMHQLARFDRLTHLPNRRLFVEQLGLLLRLSQRKNTKLAVLFIDVGVYKQVQNSLGISAGDILLREIAGRLSATLRDSDTIGHLTGKDLELAVSRLEGDEFAVVLNEVESKEATLQVARRIIGAFAEPVSIEAHELVVKPRIGIAMAPADGAEVEPLLRSASVAKLHAMEAVDEAVVFYSEDMSAAGDRRLRLESDLRHVVSRGELRLYYQPQIDTTSGSVVGAEVLLHWEHPELGMVPPEEFIELAETSGEIVELGDWVLQEACRQVRDFRDQGVKLPKVAINVSGLQFDADFVSRVSQVVAQQGIPPSQLELALSESLLTSDRPDIMEALRALRSSGVYLSVDDFGFGGSPLCYLAEYPLDELKISRQLLLAANGSDNGAKLITAIITMARSLDLRALATGVESTAQLHFLTDNGVTLIQGSLFSEPVPAGKLRTMLTPWHFIRKVQELAQADQVPTTKPT